MDNHKHVVFFSMRKGTSTFKATIGQNMMEGEKERRKKKGKTGFNQVFSQSEVD